MGICLGGLISFNSNKASDPNSISYRISFLLKNETWRQLADLFKLSFMTGVFLYLILPYIIYNLQFGFRQQYFISHTVINVTENIRKALDDGNISCRVFVDLWDLWSFKQLV